MATHIGQFDSLPKVLAHAFQHYRLELRVSQVAPDTQDRRGAEPGERGDVWLHHCCSNKGNVIINIEQRDESAHTTP